MSTNITINTPDSVVSGIQTFDSSVTVMSATQALLVYGKTTGGGIYARVLDIAAGVITHAGAELTVTAAPGNYPLAVRLTDTKAVLTYLAGSPRNAIATVLDISGSTVSNGGYYLQDASTAAYSHGFALTSSKAVLLWRTAGVNKAVVATVAGTGITYGTVFSYTYGFMPQGARLSDTAGLVTFQDGTTRAKVLTISGTTITGGSEVVVDAASTGQGAVCVLSETKAIVVHEASTDDLFATVLNISGTTITPSTPVLVATDVYTSADYYSLTASTITDTENIFVAWKDFADADKTKAVIVSESGTVVGSVVTITTANGGGRKLSTLSNASAVLVYDEIGTAPLYAVVLETDPPAPPSEPPVPIPLPTLTGIMYGGASLAGSIPMITGRMNGRVADGNSLVGILPMITGRMLSGGQMAGTFPAMVGVISGQVTTSGALIGTLPMIVGVMRGSNSGVGVMSGRLPMITGVMVGGGQLSGVLPMITGLMTGRRQTTGVLIGAIPMITGFMSATWQTSGALVGSLPMLVPSGFGRLIGELPMMTGVMSGQFVVALVYEAYAVNLQPSTKAGVLPVTRYTGMPFSGIVRYQGNYYGWGAGGLYMLGGDTDAGEPIPWAWKTGITNFGSPQKNQAREVFLHGRMGPSVTASVSVGEKADVTYPGTIVRGADAQAYRIKYGRGLKAEYWSFGFADVTGSAMEIDLMQHPTQPTTRRI
jgi:hypothetical protein